MSFGKQFLDEKTASRIANRDRATVAVDNSFSVIKTSMNLPGVVTIADDAIIGVVTTSKVKRWSTTKGRTSPIFFTQLKSNPWLVVDDRHGDDTDLGFVLAWSEGTRVQGGYRLAAKNRKIGNAIHASSAINVLGILSYHAHARMYERLRTADFTDLRVELMDVAYVLQAISDPLASMPDVEEKLEAIEDANNRGGIKTTRGKYPIAYDVGHGTVVIKTFIPNPK
jgi:hypothetical protein